MDTAKDLAESELLRHLSGEDLGAFAAVAESVTFDPEQVVYEAGIPGDSLYVIVEGTFAVRVADDNGDEVDVARLKPGSYFGEMEVIGGMGRTAAVAAEVEGRCYRFDATQLRSLLASNDRLAAHFYERVSVELVRRLRNTTRDMGFFKARSI